MFEKNKFQFILLVVLFFTEISSLAQPPTSLTSKNLSLKDAVLLSLRYNVDVESQDIQRVADKFALRVAQNEFELQYALTGKFTQSGSRGNGSSSTSRTSTLTPSVSLKSKYGTQYNLQMNNPTTQGHPNVTGTYNPGIDLSIQQPLLRGAGRAVNLVPLYDAEDSELNSKLQLKQTLISTVQSVIQRYRDLILQQNDLATDQLSLKNYEKALALNKAMVKAGRSAPSEILQAESDYASQKVLLQDSRNTVITSKRDLMNLIGLSPNIKFEAPTDVTVDQYFVPEIKKSLEIAYGNNIAYQQNLLQFNTTERQLLVAKDNMRSRLDMTMNASTGNGSGVSPNSGFRSLTNNKNTNLEFSLDLEVPIDDYSLKQGVINAKVALEQASIQLAQQRRDLERSIRNDINDIQSGWEQVKLAQKALELQQKNQDAMLARLKLGLVSTLDVSTTQENLNSARQSLIRNKVNYLNAVTTLYVDMGILLDQWGIKIRY